MRTSVTFEMSSGTTLDIRLPNGQLLKLNAAELVPIAGGNGRGPRLRPGRTRREFSPRERAMHVAAMAKTNETPYTYGKRVGIAASVLARWRALAARKKR